MCPPRHCCFCSCCCRCCCCCRRRRWGGGGGGLGASASACLRHDTSPAQPGAPPTCPALWRSAAVGALHGSSQACALPPGCKRAQQPARRSPNCKPVPSSASSPPPPGWPAARGCRALGGGHVWREWRGQRRRRRRRRGGDGGPSLWHQPHGAAAGADTGIPGGAAAGRRRRLSGG